MTGRTANTLTALVRARPQLVAEAIAAQGWRLFTASPRHPGARNPNLFGVRAAERRADAWDDTLGMLWDDGGEWRVLAFDATTDPGRDHLEHPVFPAAVRRGSGIIAPGQYASAYRLGRHGDHEALVQVAPVRAYRDADRDATLDMREASLESGLYGANIHRAHPHVRASRVGRYSAMCQVVACPIDWAEFMAAVRGSVAAFGRSFTYSLLDYDMLAVGKSVKQRARGKQAAAAGVEPEALDAAAG